MGKISVFNHVTVDGFFAGPNGEIDWFKYIARDDQWDAYTHQAARAEGTLVFGRTTYEMMKSFWPTPQAIEGDPEMAKAVNHGPKIVFSRTLESVEEGPQWRNITHLREIRADEVNRRKEGGDMVILGSGTIVRQFADLNLIDEYELAMVPVILGRGLSLFKDVDTTELKLLESTAFKNGIVLLRYSR